MEDREAQLARFAESGIRLFLLGLLVYFCFQIVSPFLTLLAWGVILATAVHPLFQRTRTLLRGRSGLAASLLVILTMSLLVIPVYQISLSVIDTAQTLVQNFEAGTLRVPPPNDSVREWPVIGEGLHQFWTTASSNLESLIVQYRSQLGSVTQWFFGFATNLGGSTAIFILSIVVAGGLLAYGDEGHQFLVKVVDKLLNENGQQFVDLGTQTVRSVAQGVIGVALIQATLSGIGLFVMDVPATGVWVIAVLMLAVVQLPPLFILGPIMIYVFSVNDTLPSVLFMIYGMLVSSSDAFLKPLFLGRGMDIPMPVILIGAIGGVLTMGILGLFIGAVALAIGYTLFISWLEGLPTTKVE